MTIPDIEAMSFADLKANREVVTEAAKKESADVLAVRYIKALASAKQRDEKLAEQGKTITALQDGLAAAKQQAEALQAEVAKWVIREPMVEEQVRGLAEEKAELHRLLRTMTERAGRLKIEATRSHQAVAQAAKLLNDALATQAVESADAG